LRFDIGADYALLLARFTLSVIASLAQLGEAIPNQLINVIVPEIASFLAMTRKYQASSLRALRSLAKQSPANSSTCLYWRLLRSSQYE
jgi:hypothetical protein